MGNRILGGWGRCWKFSEVGKGGWVDGRVEMVLK